MSGIYVQTTQLVDESPFVRLSAPGDEVVVELGSGVTLRLDPATARKLAARLDSAADSAGIDAGQDQFAGAGKTSQVTDGGGRR